MSRVWGIGAYMKDDPPADVSSEFINGGYARIGWSSTEAPALFELFNRIEANNIIYIKSKPPGKTLHIKAIGVVLDKPDGDRVKVDWVFTIPFTHEISPEENRYNVYNLTLYEEMNQTICDVIKT